MKYESEFSYRDLESGQKLSLGQARDRVGDSWPSHPLAAPVREELAFRDIETGRFASEDDLLSLPLPDLSDDGSRRGDSVDGDLSAAQVAGIAVGAVVAGYGLYRLGKWVFGSPED